jgi:hypothetical protein
MVMLLLCPLLAQCIIDSVAFQSKHEHLEAGNANMMS